LTIAEIIFGPLLATVFLVPFLTAGAMGVGFAILATLAEPSQQLSARFKTVQPQLMLIAWAVGAVVGVVALWVSILRREEESDYHKQTRLILVACLLLGEVAALRRFWVMVHLEPAYGVLTWATWLCLLLGPILVSARQIWRLALSPRRSDV
jgi:hypothetical protein